jgi:hypothetical protein
MVTLTSMFGRPAVHVTEATLSPPPSLSLVNVTVAVAVPLAADGGLHRIGTVLSPGAVMPDRVHIV